MIDATDGFFDTDDFAVPVVYVDPDGVEHPINVIVNAPFHVLVVDGIEYTSKDPSMICRSGDVVGADTDAEIIYNSITYHVREVEPDGTGITILLLSLD
jgi:hypothetical protein